MTDSHHIGDYEILDLIDKGAQGSIYRARYTGAPRPGIQSGQIVALKRLMEDDQYFQRQSDFDTELAHPNIVRYLDHFREDGFDERPCIIMEYLEGMTLEEAIEIYHDQGGLDWEKVKNLFLQCIDGFIFAHAQGIIHRDVKPSNIFICSSGEVKLIDFGVSRRTDGQTTVGGFRGTLDYMAPDYVTVEGFTGDEQADIYSLGVCFFEALTGMLPYDKLGANAEFEFMGRWTREEEAVFSLSGWYKKHRRRKRANAQKLESMRVVLSGLSQLIKRSLSVERSKRYQNFEQMHRALQKITFQRVQGQSAHYEFFELLGQGGFGRVYKARMVSDHSHVFAIKELLNTRNAKRFRREAELMMKYPHPNIVGCVEYFERDMDHEERMYLVMEYLDGMPGSSLRDRIRSSLKENNKQQGLDVAEVLALMKHLLLGLQKLHENGILHRDIKPANIYAPENTPEQAKLLDLGIARDAASTMTKTGAPGTLDYMAPEFATHGDFKGSPGSDIYSLGMSMFEAVTGTPALPKLSTYTEPVEVAFFKRASRPPRIKYDHPVLKDNTTMHALLKKAIEPQASKRYSNARQMLEDVEKAIAGVGMSPDSVTIFTPQTQLPRSEIETVTIKDAEKLFGGLPARAPNAPSLGQNPALPPGPRKKGKKQSPSFQSQPRSSQLPSQQHPQQPSQSHAMSSLNPPPKIRIRHILVWISALLMICGAGTFYYLYKQQISTYIQQFTQSTNPSCIEAETRIKSGLDKVARASSIEATLITQLVNLDKDARFGAKACPDPKWTTYQVQIREHTTTIPSRLLEQIQTSVEAGYTIKAEAYKTLLNDLNGQYNIPTSWGRDPEEIETLLAQADLLLEAARERNTNSDAQWTANEAQAKRLMDTLRLHLDDTALLPAHLREAAQIQNLALSTDTRNTLSNLVQRAHRTVHAALEKERQELTTLYQSNLCEKAEHKYLEIDSYLKQLPDTYFSDIKSLISAELVPARDRCREYVQAVAAYRETITPFLDPQIWQVSHIDRIIDRVSDLVKAAEIASQRQLIIDNDKKRLSRHLSSLVAEAGNLQNSTRQSVTLKMEILISSLTRRQPEMTDFLSAAEVQTHHRTIMKLVNNYMLRITNLNAHPLTLTLGDNQTLPLLASQQSIVIPIPISDKNVSVEHQITAQSTGYQSITRSFLPVRGGYGEIEIGRLAEFALAAPIRQAEHEVARYRESLFQVSSYAGPHAQWAIRRYEDLDHPLDKLTLNLPNIQDVDKLPEEYRWRLQRVLLWEQGSQQGIPSSGLADKLTLLADRTKGVIREQLVVDQFALRRNLSANTESRQLSLDNGREIDRILAHNQFLYPRDREKNFKRIAHYIDHSSNDNTYDYLLAIYYAYTHLHHNSINLPAAQWKSWVNTPSSPLGEIRARNQAFTDLAVACVLSMSDTQASEVATTISKNETHKVMLLTFLEQITKPEHPLRPQIQKHLAGQEQSVKRAREVYRIWNVTPSK